MRIFDQNNWHHIGFHHQYFLSPLGELFCTQLHYLFSSLLQLSSVNFTPRWSMSLTLTYLSTSLAMISSLWFHCFYAFVSPWLECKLLGGRNWDLITVVYLELNLVPGVQKALHKDLLSEFSGLRERDSGLWRLRGKAPNPANHRMREDFRAIST